MVICTACNLASPVITGFLFEMLAGRGRSISQYPAFFAVFAAIYVIEPLLTRVYVRQVCAAAEKVCLSGLSACSPKPAHRKCSSRAPCCSRLLSVEP